MEHGSVLDPSPDQRTDAEVSSQVPLLPPLLLVEDEAPCRSRLGRFLTASGFAVTSTSSLAACRVAARRRFAYAVVGIGSARAGGLDLIRRLGGIRAEMRIVVVTDVDSFATAILALRAGAADYLPKPVDETALLDALHNRRSMLPPVPEKPLGIERRGWEHIVRIYEQCGRNVTQTARRLGMHRRSLQRMLSKRAPYRQRQL